MVGLQVKMEHYEERRGLFPPLHARDRDATVHTDGRFCLPWKEEEKQETKKSKETQD